MLDALFVSGSLKAFAASVSLMCVTIRGIDPVRFHPLDRQYRVWSHLLPYLLCGVVWLRCLCVCVVRNKR